MSRADSPDSSTRRESWFAAYFFIPLPEPLPLPDRQPFVCSRDESTADLLERIAAGDPQDSEPRIYRYVSIVAHQRIGTIEPAARAFDLADVAQEFLPWACEDSDPQVQGRTKSSGIADDLTVMEAAVYLPDPDAPGAVSDAFDEALWCIQRLQEAYYLTRRTPVTLCRRETLPTAIPYAIGEIGLGDTPTSKNGISLFLTNMNLNAHVRDEELTEQELELLSAAFRSPRHAFATSIDLLRDARSASERRGDHRVAAVLAGASGESFIDTVLLHLLWEDCTEPRVAAELFSDPRRGLVARAVRDLGGRVGGSWDLTKDVEFRTWHTACYQLRHRSVHAGYFPSIGEARDAIQAVEGLVAKVGRALRSPSKLTRYPRTAILVSSEAKLRSAGLWRGEVKRVAISREEPNWSESFARWLAVVELHRALLSGTAHEPDPRRARLLCVFSSDGIIRWVLHDHATGMACTTEAPAQAQTGPLADSLERMSLAFQDADANRAQSVLLTGDEGSPAQATGPWVPAHELVPEAAVMLDDSDPGLR